MKGLLLLLYYLLLCELCDGKVFTRCQLSRELVKTNMIQKSFLGSCMRNTRVIFVALILCYVPSVVFCKRFETRCKLVRELLKVGIPNDMFLGQWVCLIEKASNRNTSAFVVTPSGKKYYGLYQIPNPWCKEKKRGGDCNIKCEDLLDEDIRDDTACAVMIYQQEGFKYWPVWTTRCKNDNFITEEIYKCPDLRFSPDRSSPVNF